MTAVAIAVKLAIECRQHITVSLPPRFFLQSIRQSTVNDFSASIEMAGWLVTSIMS